MKAIIIVIAILFSFSNLLTAQTRTIYGRVIGEDGEVAIGDRIQNKDTLLLGTTGIDGRFKIGIPQNTQTLLLFSLGLEPTTIKLNGDCDTLEIVMMNYNTYDFMSSRKIDRLRLERFNKLPEVHLQAYKKGIFTKESVCYSREFEPHKPALDEIKKEMIKKEKQVKLTFERLTVGDTIKIPFSGQFRHNNTDTTKLGFYSSFSDFKNYDCIIKGVIIDKNKHRRGYNLVYKVINCDLCKYPVLYDGRAMKIGEVFTYNMKYFKILDE